MRLIKSGKVKDVYEVSDRELEFVFSDRVSVFDKIIPSSIPHKGETLARTSAYWFEVAERLGIPTHFIGLKSPNRMRVKRVEVVSDYRLLNPQSKCYLIPLECVSRHFVYGSLWDRVKEKVVLPLHLGFPANHDIKLGEPLPEPFFEVTTKLEKYDRPLTTEEALRISGMTPQEFEQMKELALQIDEEIGSRVRQRGLIHVDGKKEFAFDEERVLMVVDTMGTADEDRFWDAEEFGRGRFIERSKEFVRQYYRRVGYYNELTVARKEGRIEPPIPPLPEYMVEQTSKIYVRLFEDITGQPFR
ncbi:MAG: phosphoribosylaminoimidazolesuccinocarboxamide synthase [Candidatus Bathyarchaeia archaeon]